MSEFRVTSFRQELKVLAVLVCFLAGLEMIALSISNTLDDDRAHIAEFDAIVGGLGPEKRGAVLGNSLLLHGFDEEQFARESPEFSVIKITPVATAVLDWGHLYERYFLNSDKYPEHLFIGFVAHHVDDSEPAKLRRLSRHFVDAESLPYLWDREGFDFHQRVQSMLAHTTSLIGDQPAHRERVLDYFIDWYRLGLRTNQEWVTGEVEELGERPSSYARMERFVELVKSMGVQLWLIPMPQPDYWAIDPQLLELIEKNELGLLDARSIPGMSEEDFSDGYHLGASGAEKFTRWFAGEVSAKVTRDP
ncbi:hypothetical protein N9230_01905 [Akkermansiaceae bacterium]|nr:hypothetical protein [Akkermansiaceae bacterium]